MTCQLQVHCMTISELPKRVYMRYDRKCTKGLVSLHLHINYCFLPRLFIPGYAAASGCTGHLDVLLYHRFLPPE